MRYRHRPAGPGSIEIVVDKADAVAVVSIAVVAVGPALRQGRDAVEHDRPVCRGRRCIVEIDFAACGGGHIQRAARTPWAAAALVRVILQTLSAARKGG